ncbi:MAG: ABC transporter ATP-binding protein, partial [Chloroflexi bacterium]|nr:ABC transporter ATP-binding protein [Chloroflexota bacterium]
MNPKIVCSNLSKIFPMRGGGELAVLDDLNFEVKENEFLVLLGP